MTDLVISPEVLNRDAEFVLSHAHETIAPYAAERLRQAASTIEALSERIAVLDWFGRNTRLSLEHYSPVYGDDDDQRYEWRVICQSGNISDREYHCIGRGETPFNALTNARASLTPDLSQ